MASPEERPFPRFEVDPPTHRSSDEEGTVVAHERPDDSVDSHALRNRLRVEIDKNDVRSHEYTHPSPSQTREEASRLDDELAVQRAERTATSADLDSEGRGSTSLQRSRSHKPEPIDDFDAATNPLHERAAVYKPPENPESKAAKVFKYVHESSFIIRYFVYIVPIGLLIAIPIFIGALTPAGKNANVAGVQLLWFGVWLEIVWLTLWAARFAARLIPWPFGLISSLFTNNSKKWRDLGKQLEIPATIFFWWLGIEVSFLPTMTNHHSRGVHGTQHWEKTMNKVLVAIFVGAILNFVEKIIIQLIAISFHLRTYADRIEINKFQIGSLTKLYIYSKAKIAMEDEAFEEKSVGPASGARTPAMYAAQATQAVNKAMAKVGDATATVAGDFTGKKIAKSGHPSQVVLALLHSTSGSQVLARRLYRTFVVDDSETVSSDDLKSAFDNNDEAEAAFSMFDKDMNGDISMDELEAVCVEIGRERKAITASLKDLDSVVSKLDDVLFFIVLVITVLVFISLISTSAAGVLTSAGSAVLALSWLFSATAQEFLQSVVFVFVKHPFDVGDRVSIYGNTGSQLKGDDYFVKEIALLYTEFKKMEGQVVQAPNSYLNTLFIMNMRRSGGLAEAVPIVIRFGTSLEQIEGLRNMLLDFVRAEKREFQGNILTELRDVTEAWSLTLNVVFFYKTNWQNELLRLQRRNKFICAMMTCMQELGIEGPRRNNAGWRSEVPMYMQLPPGAPPLYSASNNDGPAGHHPSVSSQVDAPLEPLQPQHSILRRRPSTGQIGRPRGESLSQMSKRVDFSLGMKDISSGDMLGDVSEERDAEKYRTVIEDANRASDRRRESESRERIAPSRSKSRRSGSISQPHASGGLLRRSTEQWTNRNHRESMSSVGTHRNRFIDRFGPTRSNDSHHDTMVEEGRAPLDPRSGNVSAQAVRMESASSVQREPPSLAPVVPMDSQAEDFELRRWNSPPDHRSLLRNVE